MKRLFMILSIVFLLKNASCANILYIGAMPSPSHYIWNRALGTGLAAKGHNVTLITPDEPKQPSPANYTSILLEGYYEKQDEEFDINAMASYSSLQMIWEYQAFCYFHCEVLTKTKGMAKLLSYPSNFFDLIIIDVTAGNCFYPLIQRFGYPPTIAVVPFLLPVYASYNFGNHIHPTYVPWYGLAVTTEMSFLERVANSIYTVLDVALRHLVEYDEQDRISRRVFGNDTASWRDIEKHIGLLLANYDPILGYPQPLPPNIIPVGGLHAKVVKKLPEEFQTYLDNSKDGAILFSLGTNIRSDKLSGSQQRALLDAFSKLKQNVIWKFESEISDLPKNVIVKKWLPQNDILGHPNVKVFIGHGGALSTQEAIFHGVPMIAIPFIVDQYINTKMLLQKKLGVSIDSKAITSETVSAQLREVLLNPIYADNMKKASRRFRDRPETPLERAIFWTEYVLRHGGAEFLNTPARHMPWYVSSGADVVTLLLLILLTVTIVTCKLLQLLIKKCLLKSPKKIKQN